MKYPNMIDPTKKDMEQLGAIRHYLDNPSSEPEFPTTSSDDKLLAFGIIYILIAVGLIFTGFGALVGIAMLIIGFVVYKIAEYFGW
jgi:hypothetical protein